MKIQKQGKLAVVLALAVITPLAAQVKPGKLHLRTGNAQLQNGPHGPETPARHDGPQNDGGKGK